MKRSGPAAPMSQAGSAFSVTPPIRREDGSEVQLWFTALHVADCDMRHFLTTSSRLSKPTALPVVRVEVS